MGTPGGSGGGTASRATVANDNNLSIINRSPMGLIPVVHQFLTENSGSRLSDTNPIEYIYVFLVMIIGSHSYNPSRQEARVEEHFPVPATLNKQLFLGGPAAAMHARMQQRLHPLLCSVNLVPANLMRPYGWCR